MSGPVWGFIGQLVTNMLSADKETKQLVQFHYSQHECECVRQSASKTCSLIACGKLLGNHNGSQGLQSKAARVMEPHSKEYITPAHLALEKYTNFNKGVRAIGRSGSHLLLLTLWEVGETHSVIATLSQTVNWNSH